MLLKEALCRTTMLCGTAAMLLATVTAYANPQGGNITAGSASISESGNTLTIQQTSNKAIITFKIGG